MFRSLLTKCLTVRGRLTLLAGVAVSTMLAVPVVELAEGRSIDALLLAVPGAGVLVVVLLALATARALLPPFVRRSRPADATSNS
jgi:hypothetical protein